MEHKMDLKELAQRYQLMEAVGEKRDGIAMIVTYFLNKIIKFDDKVKALKIYNTKANLWIDKYKLDLPKDFVNTYIGKKAQ